MRRRYWWQLVDKITDDTNFVWSQLKIADFFKSQSRSKVTPKMYRSKTTPIANEDQNRFLMTGQDLYLWERYYGNNIKF